jgi:hypothetical protein
VPILIGKRLAKAPHFSNIPKLDGLLEAAEVNLIVPTSKRSSAKQASI